MRASNAAKLMLGAAMLVAGFGVMTDGAPTRGAVAQSIAGLFDMKDRQCRHAPTAVGSACPRGCEAPPLSSAEDRGAPTVCRSRLWVITCGKACAPESGFTRLSDGALASDSALIVVFRAEPDRDLLAKISAMGVTLSSRYDGLFRYDAALNGDISKIKKRLSALPGVVSVEFVPR